MIPAMLTMGSLSSLIFAVIIFRATSHMLFDMLGSVTLAFTIWTHSSQLGKAFYFLEVSDPQSGRVYHESCWEALTAVCPLLKLLFALGHRGGSGDNVDICNLGNTTVILIPSDPFFVWTGSSW